MQWECVMGHACKYVQEYVGVLGSPVYVKCNIPCANLVTLYDEHISTRHDCNNRQKI